MSQTELTTAEIERLGWTHAHYLNINQSAHHRAAAIRVVRPPPLLFDDQARNLDSILLYTLVSLVDS
jgi:hypothetical protein